jgi:hypothetical protein
MGWLLIRNDRKHFWFLYMFALRENRTPDLCVAGLESYQMDSTEKSRWDYRHDCCQDIVIHEALRIRPRKPHQTRNPMNPNASEHAALL